jgi:hypothetical protein
MFTVINQIFLGRNEPKVKNFLILLLHFLTFFRLIFYKYMVVISIFLLEEAMYSYCCLCILIVNLRILIVVYVLSMYS